MNVPKPNLFILGAPKCGTTSLASWLGEHSHVFMSPNKEPHHFYSPHGLPMTRIEYEELFSGATGRHQVVGEASTWYLFSKTAAAQILEYQPEAKFVVCLRSPVEMAISLHNQQLFTGHERVVDFGAAWKLGAEREAGKRSGTFGIPQGDVRHLSYRLACSIGSQLRALLDVVSRDRVHVVLLDDMRQDAASCWRSCLDFLELTHEGRKEFPAHNAASRQRSSALNRLFIRVSLAKQALGIKTSLGLGKRLGRLNSVEHQYVQPSFSTRRNLYESLRPEIEILEKVLDRGFASWTPVESL